MRRITILDDYQNVALQSADWAPLGDHFEIDVVTEHIAEVGRLVDRLRGSEVVVAMRERTPFPAETLEQLHDLRLLVTTGMKNASIDLAEASKLGIVVCGTDSPSATTVPELTFGMMIALARNMVAEDASMHAGGWQHTLGTGLAGKTLGIVGLGRIGEAVAKLAAAFQMSVVAWSPRLTAGHANEIGVSAVDRHTLFANSDFVTAHVRLSDESRRSIGAQEFAWMRSTAYFINTSRGEVIDEPALIEALRSKRIAGAGLDVYGVEPLPNDHPLRGLPNALLLPHIGYVTSDSYRTFYSQAVENVAAYLSATPLRVLNPASMR